MGFSLVGFDIFSRTLRIIHGGNCKNFHRRDAFFHVEKKTLVACLGLLWTCAGHRHLEPGALYTGPLDFLFLGASIGEREVQVSALWRKRVKDR